MKPETQPWMFNVADKIVWMVRGFADNINQQHHKAVGKAVDLLAAHAPQQWIPVTPETHFEGEKVVIQLRDGSELHEAIQQHDRDWWWRERFFSEFEVVAYRPLPAPPVPETPAKPTEKIEPTRMPCMARSQNDYTCTLPQGHAGEHAAIRPWDKHVYDSWPAAPSVPQGEEKQP